MMEGSRTGKAAEADLMIMISKNPTVEGQEEEDNQRHINVVKNKLSGWHGIVHTDLEYKIARYEYENTRAILILGLIIGGFAYIAWSEMNK